MDGAIQFARNVGVFLLFGVATVLVGDLLLFLINSGGRISGREFAGPGSVFAWGVAGAAGVYAGVRLLNRFFQPYPPRVFAAAFLLTACTLLALSLIIGLIFPGHSFGVSEWQFCVRTAVSGVAAWLMLWQWRGLFPAK